METCVFAVNVVAFLFINLSIKMKKEKNKTFKNLAKGGGVN